MRTFSVTATWRSAASILVAVVLVIVLNLVHWFPVLSILPLFISQDLLGVIQYSFTSTVVRS